MTHAHTQARPERMEQMTRLAKALFCVVLIGVCAGSSSAVQQDMRDANGFVAATPESLELEGTATQVKVLGDPSKPGMYVVRQRFAAGRGTRPHFHTQDRYITVIKGTWWVAVGPDAGTYDLAKMKPIKPGGFVFHPAGGHHYDTAKDDEVVLQIVGMGPVATTQLEKQ